MSTHDLSWAHPIVQEWFLEKLGSPTEPQVQGWPSILQGQSTLISAPTGSGKTLAAFLVCINDLIVKGIQGKLADQTQVLYISPLKALGNDIQKNLLHPLNEIYALAKRRQLVLPEITAGVRSGDTLAKERRQMLKNPPHILITTPESFYILLTAQKSSYHLSTIRTIIVDEIHALARDKRGVHLSLSLERLEALTPTPLTRIGLSATQKPLELIGKFLVGGQRTLPHCVNIGHARQLEMTIHHGKIPLSAVTTNELWDEIYNDLAVLTQHNRSVLIFTNTRKLSERIAHHLCERLGEGQVAAHHGSLSRKIRLEVEHKLKSGELKALVATASLELGIDIGMIDLVCQIGSPRSIATALQRAGRAGHWHGAISKIRFFATTRDELLECCALVHAIKEGELDKLIIPNESLDILAQQIVATCATNEWQVDELFQLIINAYPYHDLSRSQFNKILQMLSEGIAATRGRYSAYIYYDKVNQLVKGRRNSRLVAITSGGAIPETGLFTVMAEPESITVGTLDEDFAVESNRGDIILLGTTSWRVNRIESWQGKVFVENAHAAPPSVPFWRGEAPARTDELSHYVSKVRDILNTMIPSTSDENDQSTIEWLSQHCHLHKESADQLIKYLIEGKKVLGTIPSQKCIVAERFFDEGGGMQLVIHSPYGARINKAWGLALRKRFCRSFNFELQAAATDNGLNIALAEQHSFPLEDVFAFLHPNTLKEVLIQAVLQSPLFNTRWRWVATRSLALVRFRNGKKLPPHIIRILSDDLLAAVFPDAAACQDNLAGEDIKLPDHPLIEETMKDILTQALDMDGLITLIQAIKEQSIQCIAIDTPLPSVFSHEILNANPYAFLDDAPLEERRARAVEMRRTLPESVLKEAGKLDQSVIADVQKHAWPDIRNSDELHDLLQSLIALPVSMLPENGEFPKLERSGRATQAHIHNTEFCVCAEKMKSFLAIYPQACLKNTLVEIESIEPEIEDALVDMLRHWMLYLGPTTSIELSELLSIPLSLIDQTLLRLENSGFILRGRFRTGVPSIEWCERRLLSRIHRNTVDKLRKDIQPVSASQFMNWLLKWQHVAQGTQLKGEQGLLQVIHQLQGFEISANAWETQILKKRVSDYDKSMLDRLCLSGQVAWGRVSPHPATLSEDKSVIPRSIAPITFFIREDADWIPQENAFSNEQAHHALSCVAKMIYEFLLKKGASFFADIVRGTARLRSEVEMGLWELVAAGAISADGFDNLRALIDPKRRNDKRARRIHFQSASGRWTILHHDNPIESSKRIESICWMLLERYGIVFKDLIVREKNTPRWRELLNTFRRLEDRGEIRGGHFVQGFAGDQFALPYAIDSLRAMRKEPLSEDITTISSHDPLNLSGILFDGNRTSSVSNKELTLTHGVFAKK